MENRRKKFHGGWIELAEIWHNDPCKGAGGDDSCGRFMRAHHGDPATLARIVKRLEGEWDNTWQMSAEDHANEEEEYGERPNPVYCRGLFNPKSGMPVMSPGAIALNVFHHTVSEHFDAGRRDWSRAWRLSDRFMQKNLYQILRFAENPVDSMRDSIVQTFVSDPSGGTEKDRARSRRERIEHFAAIAYGWVLRETRPWWKSPNLHVHHWRITVPAWSTFRRWAFSRCADCGKGLGWNKSVSSDWSGKRLSCWRCSGAQVAPTSASPVTPSK